MEDNNENLDEKLITFKFKASVLAFHKKKKKLVHDYPVDAIALKTSQAIEIITDKFKKNSTYELRKINKVICKEICNAFFPNKEGMPELTQEEKQSIEFPEDYYNENE